MDAERVDSRSDLNDALRVNGCSLLVPFLQRLQRVRSAIHMQGEPHSTSIVSRWLPTGCIICTSRDNGDLVLGKRKGEWAGVAKGSSIQHKLIDADDDDNIQTVQHSPTNERQSQAIHPHTTSSLSTHKLTPTSFRSNSRTQWLFIFSAQSNIASQ
jgi:hypothetical protein